jgi:carboxylate-amine ligase
LPLETDLRASFDAPAPLTVGVEEELMLLDAATLDLAPRAPEVIAALEGDERFKLELPASQVEIVLPPLESAAEVAVALAAARRDLAAAAEPLGVRVAGAGVHPFASPLGVLNPGERYELIAAQYGDVARLQLVFALQVHVCVRGADRALAVHNALRAELPLVAALAANAPLYAGRDSGLASVRPKISQLLPRQGMPPAIASWEAHAAALGLLADPAQWWWELRPHPLHATLEVRVPDTQASVGEAAAVVAVVHALAAWLCERFDAGEELGARPTWELDEDRWLALRHGIGGGLGDFRQQELHNSTNPLRGRVLALLDALAPVAARQGAADQLATARAMAEAGGGAQRQRAAFARGGAHAAVADLADRFAGG